MVDEGKDVCVGATREIPICLAHVNVDKDLTSRHICKCCSRLPTYWLSGPARLRVGVPKVLITLAQEKHMALHLLPPITGGTSTGTDWSELSRRSSYDRTWPTNIRPFWRRLFAGSRTWLVTRSRRRRSYGGQGEGQRLSSTIFYCHCTRQRAWDRVELPVRLIGVACADFARASGPWNKPVCGMPFAGGITRHDQVKDIAPRVPASSQRSRTHFCKISLMPWLPTATLPRRNSTGC